MSLFSNQTLFFFTWHLKTNNVYLSEHSKRLVSSISLPMTFFRSAFFTLSLSVLHFSRLSVILWSVHLLHSKRCHTVIAIWPTKPHKWYVLAQRTCQLKAKKKLTYFSYHRIHPDYFSSYYCDVYIIYYHIAHVRIAVK